MRTQGKIPFLAHRLMVRSLCEYRGPNTPAVTSRGSVFWLVSLLIVFYAALFFRFEHNTNVSVRLANPALTKNLPKIMQVFR